MRSFFAGFGLGRLNRNSEYNHAPIGNLAYHCRSLAEQHVYFEAHTFAGAPHGIAGRALVDKKERYPGFALWTALADQFMQNVYEQQGV